ncbi:ATP-binding protein [Gordonibacter massiliensis (ex Traore et al. 2017)]
MLPDMSDQEFEYALHRMRVAGTDTQGFEVKTCGKALSRDIGRTISGFANGSGGMILCGLSESDSFKPVAGFDAAAMQDAIANFCNEKMTPPIRPIIQLRLYENAPIVAAYIPELRPKQKPCYVTACGCYGGSFIRVGDGDRRLSGYEIDRLLNEREQPRYDDEIVVEASFEDLDDQLVANLLERERAIHASHFRKLDDETALCKLHVLKQDENGALHPTKAGLVALGSYPQEFFPSLNVTFACYVGNTKGESLPDGQRFVDSFTCVGPIPTMVYDAVAAVRKNMRIGSRIEGAFRHDVPDFPLAAVREAITNALMHRDYSADACGTPVHVDLYADRLEVTNPGGLFGTVTIDTLGGRYTISSRRNQYLANILESTPYERSGFVAENRGSGYQAIVSELAKAQKPEVVPFDSISLFSLTFPLESRESLELGAAASNAPVAKTRESVEYAIVEIAAARETVSMSELLELTKRSRPTVLKRVRDLVARGVLVPTEARTSPKQRYRYVGSPQGDAGPLAQGRR